MLRDLSFSHILILLAIIALIFGARRLPEIGASFGKGIRETVSTCSSVAVWASWFGMRKVATR